MPASPHFFSSRLDRKVRPQDDFFAYANGPWLKANPIPKTHAIWGSFYKLGDDVQHQLKALLEKIAKGRPRDPGTKKLQAYWRVAMDEKRLEEQGAEPVLEELARIDAVEDRKELPALIARLHNLNVNAFWDYSVSADLKRNKEHIVDLMQDGLGLPDRDYYLKTDAVSKKIRAEYVKTIVRHMRLAGWSANEAAKVAKTVLSLETRLAKASMTSVELRDIPSQYNKMSVPDLWKKASGMDWQTYLDALGIPRKHARKIIVAQPKFMAEVARVIAKAPLDDLKAYLSWHLVADSAPYLSKDFVNASFAFYGKVLSGRKELQPRWKRVLNELNWSVGELVGKAYVAKHFPESSRKRMDILVDDLFAAYRARMTALPWMSVRTMAKAVEKLDAMRRKIGFPKKWHSYAGFKPDESSLLAMHWAAVRCFVDRGIGKLGKPVDRSEWHMSPQTVNAYCDFVFNEIVFPAAILQSPHFDPKWPDALNYGAIGAIIGHELTHAFDDQGSGFDKDGNLKTWWARADKKKFDAETKRLVKQYNAYVVLDNMKCNGALTLGENIADIGGLAIAYDALEQRIGKERMHRPSKGFTPAQEFFVAYAQSWAVAVRPAEARRRLMTDSHAPPQLRVNAALPNLQEFHDAFGIRPGDQLYRKPADRVSIW